MSRRGEILQQLEHHLGEAARLRAELDQGLHGDWRPTGFYTMYHVLAGIVLGGIGAAASLLWNVLGATLFRGDQNPLYLIQVYLTFGMGEKALDPETDMQFALFAGSLLYLATGAIYGIILQLILQGLFGRTSWTVRAIVATAFGVGLWAVNFTLLLPWLQPLLFQGNWIVENVEWYVGLSTHLVFAWAFLLFASWGRFDFARQHAPWGSGEQQQPPEEPPTAVEQAPP